MNISEYGLQFIAGWEGLRNHLYNDDGLPSATSRGNATIGVGHLVHMGPIDGRAEEAPFANGLTDEQCYALLREDGQRFVDHVNGAITVPLNQNQFDALVCFAFNLGSLLRVRDVVNGGGDVCAELVKYILPAWASAGLLRRRKAECELYMTPVEEDEMRSFMAWVPQQQKEYLIGPSGAVPIHLPALARELEALFGPMIIALSVDAINAIGLAK